MERMIFFSFPYFLSLYLPLVYISVYFLWEDAFQQAYIPVHWDLEPK